MAMLLRGPRVATISVHDADEPTIVLDPSFSPDEGSGSGRGMTSRKRYPARSVAFATVASLLAVTACGGNQAELATSGHPAAPNRPERNHSVAADGDIGDRVVTVADTDEPAVSNLDPQLLAALRDATHDAAEDGITIQLNSGWRTADYQSRLLDEAIEEHGSREEALRWVSTPDESAHVTGDAVDVGPTDAAYWMSRYGSDYGLCQTFANEIWHYQLMVEPGGTCPPSRPDGAS